MLYGGWPSGPGLDPAFVRVSGDWRELLVLEASAEEESGSLETKPSFHPRHNQQIEQTLLIIMAGFEDKKFVDVGNEYGKDEE